MTTSTAGTHRRNESSRGLARIAAASPRAGDRSFRVGARPYVLRLCETRRAVEATLYRDDRAIAKFFFDPATGAPIARLRKLRIAGLEPHLMVTFVVTGR